MQNTSEITKGDLTKDDSRDNRHTKKGKWSTIKLWTVIGSVFTVLGVFVALLVAYFPPKPPPSDSYSPGEYDVTVPVQGKVRLTITTDGVGKNTGCTLHELDTYPYRPQSITFGSQKPFPLTWKQLPDQPEQPWTTDSFRPVLPRLPYVKISATIEGDQRYVRYVKNITTDEPGKIIVEIIQPKQQDVSVSFKIRW